MTTNMTFQRGRFRARCLCTSALAAIAISLSVPATASTTDFDLVFSRPDLPIWNSADAAPTFTATLAEVPLGASIGPDAVISIPGFGDFGLEANFEAGINIALETKLTDFHLGSLDLNYPVTVSLDLPGTVRPGDTITIGSSFSVDPLASFSTKSNDAKLDIGANTGVFANLDFRACIFDCFIDESLLDISQPIGTLPLVRQTKDETVFQIDIPGYGKPTIAGPGIDIDPDNTDDNRSLTDPDLLFDIAVSEITNTSGKIQTPDLEVQSNSGVPVLTGTDTDIFTNIDVNLAGFLPGTTLANFGPVDVGAGVQLGYDLFSSVLSTSLIQQQMFDFEAVPQIDLDIAGIGMVSFAAGDSVEIVVPDTVSELDITPMFSLNNSLTNTTTLAATEETTITVGGLFLSLPDITVFAGTADINVPSIPSVCIVPIPAFLGGGCAIRTPSIPGFTIPGLPDITVPGFTFDEAIYRESFSDGLLNLDLGGNSLDVDLCVAAPDLCNTLPLINQVDASEEYMSMLSYDLGSFEGDAFSIPVSDDMVIIPGPDDQVMEVPVPGSVWFVLAGFAFLGWKTKRRGAEG